MVCGAYSIKNEVLFYQGRFHALSIDVFDSLNKNNFNFLLSFFIFKHVNVDKRSLSMLKLPRTNFRGISVVSVLFCFQFYFLFSIFNLEQITHVH